MYFIYTMKGIFMSYIMNVMLLLCLYTPFWGYAQKSDTLFVLKYHSNRQLSTKEVVLNNEQVWGYAKAFDVTGKLIYSMQTRSVAGHASVSFSYFPNGAVRMAHFTSHPDGGIQWGDIKHFFDEKGNIIRIENYSSDMYGNYRVIQP